MTAPSAPAAGTLAISVAGTLAVSVVVFRPDWHELEATLASLERALAGAGVRDAALFIVNNDTDVDTAARLQALAVGLRRGGLDAHVISGHGNVGYGRGHNLAIRSTETRYHLVLNPDVTLDEAAIAAALAFMEAHPDVGALSPRAASPDGSVHYLCKRYPSVLALALRAAAPGWLRRALAGYLARYEMRDLIGDADVLDVPIISGAFMFFRGDVLRAAGGFDEGYFLYFEDFDLSLRARRIAPLAYAPAVRVRHAGGNAARKGLLHIRLFARSAFRFFSQHGWRLV